MINNRWCMDYCVMQDRLNGKVKTYPAAIPPVDLYWMITGPLCLLLGLLVAAQCKSAQASTPAPKAAAPATAAST
jgi:hypothetical protein